MAAKKPLTARQIERFIELIGTHELAQAEAAGAIGTTKRTAERLMAKPDIRERVEQLRNAGPSAAASITAIIDSMLVANKTDGSPNHHVRHKGAEMRLKYAHQYDSLTVGDDPTDDLPEGVTVFMLYPRSEPDAKPDEE